MSFTKNIIYSLGILVTALVISSGVLLSSSPNSGIVGVQDANALCLSSCPYAGSGSSCSGAGVCGAIYGVYDCNGSCVFAPGASSNQPANYGQMCLSPANVCGDKVMGYIQCNGSCSAASAPATNATTMCLSAANRCGDKSMGYIRCDGSCTAVTPADTGCIWDPVEQPPVEVPVVAVEPARPTPQAPSVSGCTSAPNACGQVNTGTSVNGGTCSASTPSNPAGYGSSCASAANICGKRNYGSIGCGGSCSAGAPSNGSCNPNAVYGCTDSSATNYDPLAYPDNGTCIYGAELRGCTDSSATNYNASANIENGSCYYGNLIGCGDPSAANYSPNVSEVDNSMCVYGIPGCTNPNAPNYNAYAEVDNGTCSPIACPSGYVQVGDACVIPGVIAPEIQCSLDQDWSDDDNSCDQTFVLQSYKTPIFLRANPIVTGGNSCSMSDFQWTASGGTNVSQSVSGNKLPIMSLINVQGDKVEVDLTNDSVQKIFSRTVSVSGTPSGACSAVSGYDTLNIKLINIALIEE